MDTQQVLRYYEVMVKLGLQATSPKISPDVEESDNRVTPLFKLFVVTHVSFCLAASSYCLAMFGEMSLTSLTEPAALSIILFRDNIYLLMMYVHRNSFLRQFNKILRDRKASVADPSLVSLTLDFCKTEFKVTAIYAAIVAGAVIFGLTGLLIFLPNAFQLPMKFYILFLPIDGAPVNWAINYAFQLIDEFCALIFYLGYFCMTLILMNHSCWVIDSAVLTVHELGEKLLTGEVDNKAVRSDLELIIDESLAIIAWMNEARNIMRISFLAEISFLSSILCMGIFTFITNPFESIFALIVTMTVFSQLSVYCWMGSRVNSRIDDFVKALYNIRWDRMAPGQQKDLQMVLMMTQHIKGFDALFKSVDLRLFQNVLEVTYTLMTLLRTTNKK